MSQPKAPLTTILPAWVKPTMLQGMLRGIERETLRMQSDGYLSQKNHPNALGSALTHPHITTDYSEALMEFITPPQNNIPDVLDYLKDLHTVAHENLPKGERLWAMSMPCMLNEEEEQIPLAQYGTSNLGRFKTLYRHGLGVRYGRRMQTIAGLHYNISFPDVLFEQLQQHETNEQLKQLNLQDYRSARYFGLIRNFIRLTPMVMFLLGASPTVCRSFLLGREHNLEPLIGGTLYKPHATALRMGRIGYQNSAQKKLGIQYNNLNDYLTELQKAVKTPFDAFAKLGLENEQGEPTQVNDHILQIENEYYSLVRPKQVPQENETPSQALAKRGVQYVELRAVDINPYSPIGVDEESAGFLEVLALYCLLLDSPSISDDEQNQIEANQIKMIETGRDLNTLLAIDSGDVSVEKWLELHLNNMHPIATILDESYDCTLYSQALQTMQKRGKNVDETLSARVVGDMVAHGGTWRFGSALAEQHTDAYSKHTLSSQKRAYFDGLVVTSHQEQQALERNSKQTFQEYLSAFR